MFSKKLNIAKLNFYLQQTAYVNSFILPQGCKILHGQSPCVRDKFHVLMLPLTHIHKHLFPLTFHNNIKGCHLGKLLLLFWLQYLVQFALAISGSLALHAVSGIWRIVVKCEPQCGLSIYGSIHNGLHTTHFRLQTTHCVIHTLHYKRHTTQYNLHTRQCTTQTKQYTLYTTPSPAPKLKTCSGGRSLVIKW